MTINFNIIGEPTGKGRPKFSRQGGFVKTYTPEKTANYEQWVKLSYIQQCGKQRFDDTDHIAATIKAYFAIPKSASKKRTLLMQQGTIKPNRKPDVDNIAKIILDSLNGLAYKDDAQVVTAEVHKLYVPADNTDPYVSVQLTNENATTLF